MDHLVQRADLGMPERDELGEPLAPLIGLAETVLEFGDLAGVQIIRTHFVDHSATLAEAHFRRRNGMARSSALAVALGIALVATAGIARGQAYPDRPVRLIVPFQAG